MNACKCSAYDAYQRRILTHTDAPERHDFSRHWKSCIFENAFGAFSCIWSNVSSSFHCPILDNKLILDKLRPMETDVSDMTSQDPIDMLMWNLVEPFGS